MVPPVLDLNDPVQVARCLRRRPGYVLSFLILWTAGQTPGLKIYQLSRMVPLDYYTTGETCRNLAKKGFLKSRNGSMEITAEGDQLKEILGQLVVLFHRDDVKGGKGNWRTNV